MVSDIPSSVPCVEASVHVRLTLLLEVWLPQEEGHAALCLKFRSFRAAQLFHTLQTRSPPRDLLVALVSLQCPNLVKGPFKKWYTLGE